MRIAGDDPLAPDVAALLAEHFADMARHAPPASTHTLKPNELVAPDLTFWTAREGHTLMGFAALLELAPEHGEIKSMRTARPFRGRRVGTALLQFIIEESRRRNYRRLSLETGSGKAFEPAHALYSKFGFRDCAPFGSYRDDPFSRYMTLRL